MMGQDKNTVKKGVLMRCSQCLKIGHNKATCKASAVEIIKIQQAAAKAKKAQIVLNVSFEICKFVSFFCFELIAYLFMFYSNLVEE